MRHTQEVRINGHERLHMVSLLSVAVGALVVVALVLVVAGLVTWLRRRPPQSR